MTKTLEILTDTIKADLAFELLSSSTLSRYARAARAAAFSGEVAQRLAGHAADPGVLIDRADELWRSLAVTTQRRPEEVELAVLLTHLAQTSSEQANNLLRLVGAQDHGALTWVAALSRHLYQQMPSNQLMELSTPGDLVEGFEVQVALDQVGDRVQVVEVPTEGLVVSGSTAGTVLTAV